MRPAGNHKAVSLLLAAFFLLVGAAVSPLAADEPEKTAYQQMEAALSAELWAEAGRFAEEALSEGALDRNRRGRAQFAIGMAAVAAGNPDAARTAFDEALRLVDAPADVHYERFKLAWSANDWLTAATDLTKLARLTPNRARVVSLSAILSIKAGLERIGAEDALLFDMLLALRDIGYSGSPPDQRPFRLYRALARQLSDRGRRFEAEAVVEVIHDAETLFAMMADRRDSGLWPALDRKFGQRADVIAARDLEFLAKMRQAMPRSLQLIRESLKALRRHGLPQEAAGFGRSVLGQLQGFSFDPAQRNDLSWIVNETAYALLEIGEPDQAIALMGQLVNAGQGASMPVAQQINYGAILWLSGRFDTAIEAAAEAEAGMVSGYGQYFIRQIAVCSYAAKGDMARADAAIGPLVERPTINPRATQIAFLCLDRHEAGVEQLLMRLDHSDLRDDALVALLPRNLDQEKSAVFKELQARYDRIRNDPRILERQSNLGRRLGMPIRQVYWGAF